MESNLQEQTTTKQIATTAQTSYQNQLQIKPNSNKVEQALGNKVEQALDRKVEQAPLSSFWFMMHSSTDMSIAESQMFTFTEQYTIPTAHRDKISYLQKHLHWELHNFKSYDELYQWLDILDHMTAANPKWLSTYPLFHILQHISLQNLRQLDFSNSLDIFHHNIQGIQLLQCPNLTHLVLDNLCIGDIKSLRKISIAHLASMRYNGSYLKQMHYFSQMNCQQLQQIFIFNLQDLTQFYKLDTKMLRSLCILDINFQSIIIRLIIKRLTVIGVKEYRCIIGFKIGGIDSVSVMEVISQIGFILERLGIYLFIVWELCKSLQFLNMCSPIQGCTFYPHLCCFVDLNILLYYLVDIHYLQSNLTAESIMSQSCSPSLKYRTFLMTFMAYISIHTMRMGYSFVKPYFERSYQLDSMFLGLFDGLVYISLGVGHFLMFLIEGNMSRTKAYLLFGTIVSMAYSVIPILSFYIASNHGDVSFIIRYVLPGIALIVFGFCQFSAWPVLLYLINQHLDIKTQGRLLGIWSANGDIGNITGFLLGNFIIEILGLRWELTMLIAALCNVLMSLYIYIFVKDQFEKSHGIIYSNASELQQKGNAWELQQKLISKSDNSQVVPEESMHVVYHQIQNQSRIEIFSQFLRYVAEIWSDHENKLFFIAMCLLKSILYGYLLWIPIFLNHNGLKYYAGYLPIIFNISTVFGSALLGYFYQEIRQQTTLQNQQPSSLQNKQPSSLQNKQPSFIQSNNHNFCLNVKLNLKYYSLFYSCCIICLCFILFYIIEKNITFYLILSSIVGFFLGGTFNMLASNQVISMTNGDKKQVVMLSTIAMSFGNVTVGVVQIIIGMVLNVKKHPEKEKNLFVVLMVVSGIAIFVLLKRSKMLMEKH